jgi:hypothetical protein
MSSSLAFSRFCFDFSHVVLFFARDELHKKGNNRNEKNLTLDAGKQQKRSTKKKSIIKISTHIQTHTPKMKG